MLMETLRGYLTIAELNTLENLSISTADDAENATYRARISKAEAYIDQVAGYHTKARQHTYTDEARGGSTTTIQLSANDNGAYQRTNQLKGMVVEIVDGTGAGQTRAIASSATDGTATVETAFTTAPDATSFYSIYQMGKFPRAKDLRQNPEGTRDVIIIPRQLKEAVAAQVVFITEMGDDYFDTDENALGSVRIGNFSQSRGGNGGGSVGTIAPRAKQLLSANGLINRTGTITNTDALQL